MKIAAIDPGSKQVGYIIMDEKDVVAKGVLSYKRIKKELGSMLRIYNPDLCIVEKGGVGEAESMIKRILHSKNFNYIEYDSVKVRECLGLFEVGIDNQNKRYTVKKHLGIKEYNNHIVDASLLIIYHNKITKG